jgi:hypothetical protein
MLKTSARFACLLFILGAAGLCAADSQVGDVKIIANSSIDIFDISRDDLNRIYLMDKTSLPGAAHLEPVLEKSGPAHAAFLKEYIGRTDAALLTYYRGLVFSGKGSMPKSFDSDSAVVQYVAKNKGAIGYVSASAETTGVKTLHVK